MRHTLVRSRSTRQRGARAGAVVAVALALCASLLGGPAQAAPSGTDGFSGYAFDARCAPTQQEMDVWRTSSQFSGAGIYIGGSMVSCRETATDPGQPHLNSTWVNTQQAKGWRLLPIWVGPEASCHTIYGDVIDSDPARSYAAADARGRSEAAAAVSRARALGLKAGSTLWYDLEGGFDLADDDCRRSTLRFLSGWTLALHQFGYRSGVYSSISAGIHALDNADNLSSGSYVMPDQVWYAWYNGRADTSVDSRWVRPGSWLNQRVHQYQAHTNATYGGVTLTIDRNLMQLNGGAHAPRSLALCSKTSVDLAKYPKLKKGARGKQAKALQCLVKKNGVYTGRLDAKFDADVVRSVKKFQRKHTLRVTGRPDARTWTALFAQGSKPLLKVGSAGKPALRLQRSLRAAGVTSVKPTGIVTDQTARAVTKYQKKVGLAPTGVVTPDVWVALQKGRR
ncbi:glycoside hydrolase domain-containing protein [Nocardioides yefusunii]|uniref:Glycoside hydrolase domain-containing protein n=1 Tax=Nocardioides yefusunii TaxID=2500546 RepID=A0ABW1QUC4_9ACTN|nr:glycoside hydrolase domain-containing protein [Nocardioides yefusunii]